MDEDLLVRASLRNEISGPAQAARADLAGIREEAQRTNRATGVDAAASSGILTRAWEQVNLAGGKLHGTLMSLSSTVGGAFASGIRTVALGLGAATVAVGIFGLKAASQFEQTRIALDGLLGSAEAGQQLFTDLQKLNLKTPFELPEISQAARMLLGFQFTGEQVIPILKSVTDIASGLGVGADGLQRIVLNLGQVQAAGRVTGRELRDFATLGFPGYALVANILGMTKEQVRALGDDAVVSSDKFIAAVTNMQGPLAIFGGMAEKQVHSLAGLWSNVKDAFTVGISTAAGPLVDGLKPLLDPNTGAIPKFITGALTGLGPSLGKLGTQLITSLVDLLPGVMPILSALADGLVRILAAAGPGIASLAPLGDEIGKSLVELTDAIVPVMPDLVRGFVDMVAVLPDFVKFLAELVPLTEPILKLLDGLLELEPVKQLLAGLLTVLLAYRALSAVDGVIRGVAGAMAALAGATTAEATAQEAANIAQAGGGVGKLGAAGGLGKAAGPGLLAAGGVGLIADSAHRKGGAQAGEFIGGGALAGAAIGSVVPGVGTAIGAGVGALAGGLAYGAGKLWGDTPTPRMLGSTLAAAGRLEASVPGQRYVTNALVGGGYDSDHVAGRALDLVGSGLLEYGAAVRAGGGYADMHGSHLHAVFGDTASPRRPMGGPADVSALVHIADGGALIRDVTVTQPMDLEAAVYAGIRHYDRERKERG